LASRALGDLERDILGFTRERNEVPGYLIPQYYFDYLASGDSRPLAGVFYHNMVDIVSLAALFDYTADLLEHPDPTHLPSLDVVAVARLYEETGKLELAVDMYERGLMAGLPETAFYSTIERFALLRRKQGNIDLAAALWERSARLGNLNACKELSKIYEHHMKLPQEALRWVDQGLEFIEAQRLPLYQAQIWRDEFLKRKARLIKKVKHG
jgi:tetratricopeptide (TPR) repeat protein